MHLLLVERDKAAAVVIARALLADDHSVSTASSGGEGLRKLQERSTALLIVGSRLPDIGAAALVDEARTRGYRGPALLLAPESEAACHASTGPSSKGAGACASLGLPFATAELVDLARLLLQRRLAYRAMALARGDTTDRQVSAGTTWHRRCSHPF